MEVVTESGLDLPGILGLGFVTPGCSDGEGCFGKPHHQDLSSQALHYPSLALGEGQLVRPQAGSQLG